MGPSDVLYDEGHLSSEVVERIRETARESPAFASLRNRKAASREELLLTPLPSVREMASRLAETSASQDFAPTNRVQWDGVADWRNLVDGAPEDSVTLCMLLGSRLNDWSSYLLVALPTSIRPAESGRARVQSQGGFV